MIKSVNKVEICGFVGSNPEVMELKNGNQMAKLNVATNSNYQNRFGEWQKDTTWHKITLWNQLAAQAIKQISKGSSVSIIGKLSNRSYTDKNGQKRYIIEIVASEMEIIPREQGGE